MEGVSLDKLLQEDKDRPLDHNEFVASYVNLLLRESEHPKTRQADTLYQWGETYQLNKCFHHGSATIAILCTPVDLHQIHAW